MGKVKIYSNEHQAWWKSNYFGYTENESAAGIYDLDRVNKDYPEITFNENNEDYLVAVDPASVILECIDLLGRDGINSKKVAQQKLIELLPQIKELIKNETN